MIQNNPPFFQTLRFRYGAGLLLVVTIAGYFLWQGHKAHILEYLPLALVFGVCGGMHLFMHGGHGHGNSGKGRDSTDIDKNKK
ncbi:MAG: DUF2933 domain-containing protein [Rhodospirillales bacterium]|nr:DUF2933 domain-containing protein [Rhodospirillales bacterium]